MYPIYRDVSNWIILDEKIIHDFGDLEMEIPIVNVLIGTLHYDKNSRTPITRWMTLEQFHHYNEQGNI